MSLPGVAAARQGQGRLTQVDRALFARRLTKLAHGTNQVTLVTTEATGTARVKRVEATLP